MKIIILTIAFLLSFSLFAQVGAVAPGAPQKVMDDFKLVTVEGVTVNIPNNWKQSTTNKTLWSDGLGNSLNVISEEGKNISLDAYVKLSIKSMKKMLPSYKVISFRDGKSKNAKYTAYLGEYSLKDIGAPSGSIKLYSVFLDAKNLKYVITIGGLPEQFKEKDRLFKTMIDSIVLDLSYKKNIDNKGGVKTVDGKISFFIPSGWNKKEGRDMWVEPVSYSSINVIKEYAPTLKMDAYLNLSLKNLKKTIKTYSLIKRTVKTVNGNKLGILFGEFTMSGMNLKLYSVVIDLNGTKYVLSIGGPSKTFTQVDKDFNKIINSIKKL